MVLFVLVDKGFLSQTGLEFFSWNNLIIHKGTGLSNMSVSGLFNKFNFWNVRGIMNTSGLLQSLTLQETRSIHDSLRSLPIAKTVTLNYKGR